MKVRSTSSKSRVDIPDGQTFRDFFVQGISGAKGSVSLTATQEQFTDGTLALEVVEPVLFISGLITSTTTLSVDDPFRVLTGIPNTAGTAFQTTQVVSAAGPVTVQIPSGSAGSPSSVAAGGVAFDALSEGTTTISATAPGFKSTFSLSSEEVTVTPP